MNVRRNNSRNREIARIQFEFLRLSPTYELANEISYHHQEDIDFAKLYLLISNLYKPKNGSELTSLQEAELLKSYVAVANLRSIFGDLSKITFDDWWQQIGGWYYGYEHDEASVKLISTLEQGQASFEKEDLFYILVRF